MIFKNEDGQEMHTISNNVADPKPTSKRKELVDIWIQEVAKRALATPGALFAHLEISHAIGIPYILNGKTNATYASWMTYAKKRLKKNHSLFLEVIPRVGYVLKEPGDEVDVCKKRYEQGVRKIFEAIDDANRINLGQIPPGEKLDKTITFTNNAAIKAGLLRQPQISG